LLAKMLKVELRTATGVQDNEQTHMLVKTLRLPRNKHDVLSAKLPGLRHICTLL
jgi:hypothetical protein